MYVIFFFLHQIEHYNITYGFMVTITHTYTPHNVLSKFSCCIHNAIEGDLFHPY